jgi:hypothetical protein
LPDHTLQKNLANIISENVIAKYEQLARESAKQQKIDEMSLAATP